MRSANECLGKAAEMERFARDAEPASVAEDWLVMARQWRNLAHQAHWQDSRRRPA